MKNGNFENKKNNSINQKTKTMTKQKKQKDQFEKELTILNEYNWCRKKGFGHDGAIHDIATADRPKPLDMTEQEINEFVLKRCRKDRNYLKECLKMS